MELLLLHWMLGLLGTIHRDYHSILSFEALLVSDRQSDIVSIRDWRE